MPSQPFRLSDRERHELFMAVMRRLEWLQVLRARGSAPEDVDVSIRVLRSLLDRFAD